MAEKQVLKKERKRLFVSQNEVPNSEMFATNKIIREKLRKFFRSHVGREEATNPVQIFEQVLEMDPYEIDIYRREYWWNLIKKEIKNLRREVFIVHRTDRYFVLKTDEEAKSYGIAMDKSIQNIQESKRRANEWVREKKWKNF
jgi:hypothetical protein